MKAPALVSGQVLGDLQADGQIKMALDGQPRSQIDGARSLAVELHRVERDALAVEPKQVRDTSLGERSEPAAGTASNVDH
jgi:hypothetical protein